MDRKQFVTENRSRNGPTGEMILTLRNAKLSNKAGHYQDKVNSERNTKGSTEGQEIFQPITKAHQPPR